MRLLKIVYIIDSKRTGEEKIGKYTLLPINSLSEINPSGESLVIMTPNIPVNIQPLLKAWLDVIGEGFGGVRLYVNGVDTRSASLKAIRGSVELNETSIDKVYPVQDVKTEEETLVGDSEVMTASEIQQSAKIIGQTMRYAIQEQAQDIYLMEGSPIALKKKGVLVKELEQKPWTRNEYNIFLAMLMGIKYTEVPIPVNFYYDKIKSESGTMDLHADIGESNFRCHMYTSFPKTANADGELSESRANINIRVIPKRMPVLSELNLPAIGGLFEKSSGLILVSGRGNDGKSTTVAGIVNHFNHMEDKHRMILTIGEPVEFVHEDNRAWIIQKRVGEGKDARSYASATEDAMREDTDIVVIEELRTQEEMYNALRLAEIGKLVIATIHANSVEDTIERFVNEFDMSDKDQVRHRLNTNLLGILHQNLIVEQGEQYPLVSMLLVTTEEIRQSLVNTKNREDVRNMMNRMKQDDDLDTSILTRYDGGVYLYSKGFLSEERFLEMFPDDSDDDY